MFVRFVALVAVVLMCGCGATRTLTIGDSSVQHEPTEVSMGFWGSLIEPGIEHRTGQLAEAAQQRQQGAVYHDKALEAARATQIVSPVATSYDVALMNGTQIEPLPAYSGGDFSRYEEEGLDNETRVAIKSPVLQLPLAGEPGALPVAFINTSRRARTFEFWKTGRRPTRYSMTVEGGQTGVKYLQPGRYYVEMFDERGRQERFPRSLSTYRSSSRYRDPYRDYRRSLTVGSTPSYVADNGEQYFGYIRSDY